MCTRQFLRDGNELKFFLDRKLTLHSTNFEGKYFWITGNNFLKMGKVLVSPNPHILGSTSSAISRFRVHTVSTGHQNGLSLLTIACDGRWMVNQCHCPSNSNIPARTQGESDQTRTPQVGMFWQGSATELTCFCTPICCSCSLNLRNHKTSLI